MKKGQIFMPIVTVGLLIIMSAYIFMAYTHQKNTQDFFSIGKLQSDMVRNYVESEKIFFYYEKFLEYNEYKAVKELADSGGVKKSCDKRWKFNSDCEPDFKEYLKEILSEKMNNKFKELSVDSEISAYFADFSFPTGSNTAKVKYEGKVLVKKQSIVDFLDIESLKSEIKNCLQKKDMNPCNPESSSGDIYKFKRKIGEIMNENLEKEEIYLNFEIDIKNSGVTTQIFS